MQKAGGSGASPPPPAAPRILQRQPVRRGRSARRAVRAPSRSRREGLSGKGRSAERRPDPVDGIPEERVVLVRNRESEQTARREDPVQLAQRRRVVGKVLENLGREHPVEGGIAKREAERVASCERRVRGRRAGLKETLHTRVQARGSHAGGRRGERPEENARPAADVEQGEPGAEVERVEEPRHATPEGHVELVGEEGRETLAIERVVGPAFVPVSGRRIVRQRAESNGSRGLLPSRHLEARHSHPLRPHLLPSALDGPHRPRGSAGRRPRAAGTHRDRPDDTARAVAFPRRGRRRGPRGEAPAARRLQPWNDRSGASLRPRAAPA